MILKVLRKHGITISKEINRGAEGIIYSGYFNNNKVAIKHCRCILSATNEFKFSNYFSSISRPINQVICHNDNVFLIMPLLSGPDLFDFADHYRHSNNYLDIVWKPLQDLIHMTNILQKKKTNHLDIKPENIIWCAESEKWKMIDFSHTKFIYSDTFEKTNKLVGTKSYSAPEINYGMVHPKSDIWSVGVTLYSILTQQKFELSLFQNCPYFVDLPSHLQTTIINCVKENPEDRILAKH